PSQAARPALPGASDINLLAWLATCISVFAFLFFYRRGEILLYGDAIAHINIARRVFDSRTPGLLQLGTVWLPLPHLLMIPFIISTAMWRSGAGGSIPSMAGYVFAVVGVFRLTRTSLTDNAEDRHTRIAAWIAAVIFAANPNLIYMQSTAMGETVYLAFFVWAVVFFSDWIRGSNSLTKCALCIAAAALTRYDGWFLTATMTIAVLAISVRLRRRRPLSDQNRVGAATEADQNRGRTITEHKKSRGRAPLQGRVRDNSTRGALEPVKFVLIVAAAPALWLAYNGIVYRNPLEFANGPYSAKAIESRTQSAGNPGHPGSDHPAIAALYFLKSAENNVAQPEWLQRTWMFGGIAAVLVITLRFRRALPLLFLLVPIPFYALSIAYGGVPIFIP